MVYIRVVPLLVLFVTWTEQPTVLKLYGYISQLTNFNQFLNLNFFLSARYHTTYKRRGVVEGSLVVHAPPKLLLTLGVTGATDKLKKHLHQFDNKRTANTETLQIKKRCKYSQY